MSQRLLELGCAHVRTSTDDARIALNVRAWLPHAHLSVVLAPTMQLIGAKGV